jgi:ABC-type nickel/cobalt efflux system permease component RcnA
MGAYVLSLIQLYTKKKKLKRSLMETSRRSQSQYAGVVVVVLLLLVIVVTGRGMCTRITKYDVISYVLYILSHATFNCWLTFNLHAIYVVSAHRD